MPKRSSVALEELRRAYHRSLCEDLLALTGADSIPTNADKDNRASVLIARHVARALGAPAQGTKPSGGQLGSVFERRTAAFLRQSFGALAGEIRGGQFWIAGPGEQESARSRRIVEFDQYRHLHDLAEYAKTHPDVAILLGGEYTIAPDIVVAREPEPDERFEAAGLRMGESAARLSPLRQRFSRAPILHASISCTWTLRSDRAQNSRTEALNLIRNRKGRTPMIAVVTAEPLPSRLSSIALGTGDIDCIYHIALPELVEAVDGIGNGDSMEALRILVDGRRLRDISDLPLDLAV